MTSMNRLFLVLAGALVSAHAYAGGPEGHDERKALTSQQVQEKAAPCAACHGANGVSQNPIYPSLAGQYRDYLEVALTDYKAGARKNPVMAGMVAALDERDIKALAAYFAAQKGPLYTPALK